MNDSVLFTYKCQACGYYARRRTPNSSKPCPNCGGSLAPHTPNPKLGRGSAEAKRSAEQQDAVDQALGALSEAQQDLEAVIHERDELIADALAAGATRAEVMEVTKLSSGGVDYRAKVHRNGAKYSGVKA